MKTEKNWNGEVDTLEKKFAKVKLWKLFLRRKKLESLLASIPLAEVADKSWMKIKLWKFKAAGFNQQGGDIGYGEDLGDANTHHSFDSFGRI